MRSRPALIALALVLAPGQSFADVDVNACMATYESTQRHWREGKLLQAERDAITCSDPKCPAALRHDCLAWSEEIRRNTPTIALSATGLNGCDLEDGRVLVDNEVRPDGLSGRAIPVDPGAHEVRVESG